MRTRTTKTTPSPTSPVPGKHVSSRERARNTVQGINTRVNLARVLHPLPRRLSFNQGRRERVASHVQRFLTITCSINSLLFAYPHWPKGGRCFLCYRAEIVWNNFCFEMVSLFLRKIVFGNVIFLVYCNIFLNES